MINDENMITYKFILINYNLLYKHIYIIMNIISYIFNIKYFKYFGVKYFFSLEYNNDNLYNLILLLEET